MSGQQNQAFSMNALIQVVSDATVSAKNMLASIQSRRSAISIADMFEMQMLMNKLSQISEMSTSVVSAANTVLQDMSRNIK